MITLKCDMIKNCEHDVTHIDSSGFIYCSSHGEVRKRHKKCRKMTKRELKTLRDGQPIPHY